MSADSSIVAEWTAAQIELSSRVSSEDAVDLSTIKYVAGVDISFDRVIDRRACAYLCVLNFETLEAVYEDHCIVEMDEPYICGFLGFREVKHYVRLIDKLKKDQPNYLQNCVLLVDGFGVLHERKCGCASHLGVEVDLPTIGVAKTLVLLDNLDEHKVKKQFEEDSSLLFVDLVGSSGTLHGMAFRSAKKKPIYISVGHKVSLPTAAKIVQRVCRYRIPEPIRLADIRSKLFFGQKEKETEESVSQTKPQ